MFIPEIQCPILYFVLQVIVAVCGDGKLLKEMGHIYIVFVDGVFLFTEPTLLRTITVAH